MYEVTENMEIIILFVTEKNKFERLLQPTLIVQDMVCSR